MIEKLSSLKDKIGGGERADLRKRESASKKRKEERSKRVKRGRKLFRFNKE